MVLNKPNVPPSPVGAGSSPATDGASGSGSSSRGSTTPFKPLHNFPLNDLKWPMSQARNNRPSPLDKEDPPPPPPPAVEKAESKKPEKLIFRIIRTRAADDKSNPAPELVVAPPPPSPPNPQVPAGGGDGDVEREEMDVDEAEDDEDDEEEEEGPVEPKTWNLRPRKPVTKPPPARKAVQAGPRGGVAKKKAKVVENEKDKEKEREKKEKAKEEKEKLKEEKREKERMRRERLRKLRNNSRMEKQETTEVPTFSISLTKDEIEMDFLAMTGAKPPRRPKTRAKNIQKQLDNVFPGLWLDSITPETYKVEEPVLKPRI